MHVGNGYKSRHIWEKFPAKSSKMKWGNKTNYLTKNKMSSVLTNGFNAFAKSIDSRRPVQSVQADMGRNILLSINFLLIK